MKLSRCVPLVVGGILLAAATACTQGQGTGGPSASPTPSTTPTPTCPVGSWRSTAVSTTSTVAGITVTLEGGSGVTLTIGSDGAVRADFGAMQPAVFTTEVGTTQVRGEIVYGGTVSGSVTPPGSTSSSSASPTATSTPSGTPTASPLTSGSAGSGPSGVWQPTGTANVGDLRVTVKLTQPVAATVIDNVKVSDVTGSQTAQVGNAIDLQPLLRSGTYQCEGANGLVITTSAGGGPSLTWTLTRS